jgi:pimeloyl-ACP methyl ester carboxylesterase
VTDQYRNDPSNNPANSEDRIHFDVDRSVHFQKALNEAIEMRKSGELQEEGKNISCPVTAIHGVYDPHPIDGVKIPLEKNIADFRIFPLEKCGHMPWTETYAKTTFYNLLTEILEAEPSK